MSDRQKSDLELRAENVGLPGDIHLIDVPVRTEADVAHIEAMLARLGADDGGAEM